ncbi:FecCD family ABC transporter permease [Microbacterium sp. No. 7]|uniref:FecCD family ABC transporter permease n=1 Tax=Microbacterium sp. No. 7 TaxID=1714373 RepID=UPI0006ED3BE4|nr:iron ABC transporter permease [Microbacterium sp. No. 7]ALJ21587.1 hypothetical protein AOA12_17480 [Microbacterium sp. No. 7]
MRARVPETVSASSPRRAAVVLGLLILLVVITALSLQIGRYGLSPAEILGVVARALNGTLPASDQAAAVLFSVRLPRIGLAIVAGAALSAAGVAFQGLFRNPMVSPDLLGVASGASVGACIGILLSLSGPMIQLLSFASGLAAVLLVVGISTTVTRTNGGGLLIMVLAGIVISSLASAATSLTKYLAPPETKLPEITFWLMGSFARSSSLTNLALMCAVFVIGAVPLLLLRWQLNVMAFGEEEAQALGVDTGRVRLVVIVAATLLTATTVALCGVIGWVGLVIPHICRFLVGPNHLILMPCSMVVGSCFMLGVDNVARATTAGEIPLSIVTALIGAPVFLYLLFKGQRSWSA